MGGYLSLEFSCIWVNTGPTTLAAVQCNIPEDCGHTGWKFFVFSICFSLCMFAQS